MEAGGVMNGKIFKCYFVFILDNIVINFLLNNVGYVILCAVPTAMLELLIRKKQHSLLV